MEKTELNQQFAKRLWEAMIAAGHHSERSSYGVNIESLVSISGNSPQICRKYLRGKAIPEPVTLNEIATKLKVSPGWLLFGDHQQEPKQQIKNITISRNLLHYIFSHAADLYNAEASGEEVPDFLLDLVNDMSQIHAEEEQSKKIIDLALSSAKHFHLK
jgi:hypothetical protein